MSPEEAIENIEIAIAEVEWEYPMDYAIAFVTAIEALKKRIPIRPKQGDADKQYDTDKCPKCLRTVRISEFKDNYCPNCGQAIDWGMK